AWIFQMARNLAIDYMRKRKYHSSLSTATKQDHNTLEHTVSTKLDIESALQQLPSTDQEMVTLHLNGDLKFREIAKLVDKPLGTVLWRYKKSIRTYRHIMAGRDYNIVYIANIYKNRHLYKSFISTNINNKFRVNT